MIECFDHIVLTTAHLEACLDFYTRVLGMKLERFMGGTPPVERLALTFGQQKINIHKQGAEFEPKAYLPVPGSLDVCFIASVPIEQVIERLKQHNWEMIEGPVERTGAKGKICSVYVRDPDLNLIEIANYLS